jgi:1-acyl-sn-glycerol-3-phosphate acyltransferase
MGVRVRCEGVEVIKHVRPGLVHFTHSSYMDALLLLATYPHNLTAFVKAELFRIPFLGWISLAFGSIPIYRKDRSQAIAVVDRTAERCIARGDSLAVAPEGTRSKSGNLMDFKKGPFYLAENMQWPIVPTVILGNYELWPPNRAMPDSGTVVVRFLEKVQVPGEE